MTNQQYKNIVDMTLNDVKNETNMDSTQLARTIFNNCGVAFPNGSLSDVTDALATEEYMGWRKCTADQAMEYANDGTPVVGVDANGVTVVTPDTAQGQETAYAMEANVVSTTALSAQESVNTQYYAYSAGTTTTEYLLDISGIPTDDVVVGETFTLNGNSNYTNTVDVKWEYDEDKFCVWTDFMYHNYFTNFHALEPGNTTIKASYGGLTRLIPITIVNPKVTFHANGGCVSQNSVVAEYGSCITLPTPTHDSDHIFMGWFKSVDDTEKVGDAGDRYVVKGSVTLYAQWLFLRTRIFTKNACYIQNKDNTGTVGGIMVHSTAANNSSLGRYVPRNGYDNIPEDSLLQENSNGNHWNVYHPGCPETSSYSGVHTYADANSDGYCDICGGRQACVHAFIGKLKDGRVAVYQTLPWNIPGWHSGSRGSHESANAKRYIGFEICEDQNDDEYLKAAYHEAVKLCAYLCKRYNINPLKDPEDEESTPKVLSHKEGYEAYLASGHGDPDHWFNPNGYTMDGFRQDVKNMM